jgi:hypothetical protein
VVCDVSNGKALIVNEVGVQLYCLSAGKKLCSISANIEFCWAKFDSNPDRHQFVALAKGLSLFQLMSYDNDSATVLHSGTADIHSYNKILSLCHAVLLDGVLFTPAFNKVMSYDSWGDEKKEYQPATTILVSILSNVFALSLTLKTNKVVFVPGKFFLIWIIFSS